MPILDIKRKHKCLVKHIESTAKKGKYIKSKSVLVKSSVYEFARTFGILIARLSNV